MFWGKPIIHTHFSASPPSLPLVEYGAALPGFHPDEVRSSVQRLYGFSEEEMESMRECQARFLADFAGPLDGQAKNRVCALIEGILWGG